MRKREGKNNKKYETSVGGPGEERRGEGGGGGGGVGGVGGWGGGGGGGAGIPRGGGRDAFNL